MSSGAIINRHQEQSLDTLRAQFERYATKVCATSSPMYETLCRHIASRDDLLALALDVRPGQPAPNLILAAVQFTLHDEPKHPLATYYPLLGGSAPACGNAGFTAAFDDFCETHAGTIRHLVGTRLVQSSEPRRNGLIAPALLAVTRTSPEVHYVDVGSSVGFNLYWDRWSYAFEPGGSIQRQDAVGTISIRTEGNFIPSLDGAFPVIRSRVGIDLSPVDLADDSALRWIKSLIFADHVERFALFDKALDLVREGQPQIIAGDAKKVLPQVLDSLPAGENVCVLFSFVVNQAYSGGLTEAHEQLASLSIGRTISGITLADMGREATEMRYSTFQDGKLVEDRELAFIDPHGKWIRWIDPLNAAPQDG